MTMNEVPLMAASINDVLETAEGDRFMVRGWAPRHRGSVLVLAAGRTDEGFEYAPGPGDRIFRYGRST